MQIIFLVTLFFSYASLSAHSKNSSEFRAYEPTGSIARFYATQHEKQTLDFVTFMREQLDTINFALSEAIYHNNLTALEETKKIKLLSVWDMLLELDNLIDESDPDTSLPNSVHALQTAEAIRANLEKIAYELKVPEKDLDWLPLVGLIHDMGKAFALLGNFEQWAVVGDTFPLGCAFSPANIYADSFKNNPDFNNPKYNSKFGIYKPNIGLNNLLLSFGHDEYMYSIASRQSKLPEEALRIIRYHSCYPIHSKNAYEYLLAAEDNYYLRYIKAFNAYDLYSKNPLIPDREALKAYYLELINKYFPPQVAWIILS
jgi:inositol oxygenase